jgi:hypothetical protein
MPPPWRIRDYAWNIRDRQWEHEIVERIRQTGALDASSFSDLIPDQYSVHLGGWEAAEKHAAKANRLHSAYLDDASIAKRAAKRELLRQGMEEVAAAWQAYREGKGPRPSWENPAAVEQARRKADAEAKEKKEKAAIRQVVRADREAQAQAEAEAWWKDYKQRQAEKAERQAKERTELDRMLATARDAAPDVAGFQAEERRILDSKWSCTVCGGKSTIERKSPGYQLQCTSCGKSAWGSHKSLWEVLSK